MDLFFNTSYWYSSIAEDETYLLSFTSLAWPVRLPLPNAELKPAQATLVDSDHSILQGLVRQPMS